MTGGDDRDAEKLAQAPVGRAGDVVKARTVVHCQFGGHGDDRTKERAWRFDKKRCKTESALVHGKRHQVYTTQTT